MPRPARARGRAAVLVATPLVVLVITAGLGLLPAAASRFWSADITVMMLIATGIGLASSLAGLLISYHAELPAGPAIILAAGAAYLASLALGREGGLVWLLAPRRHLEA